MNKSKGRRSFRRKNVSSYPLKKATKKYVGQMMMMMTLTCIFFTYMYIILRAYKHYVENKACLDVDDGGNEEAEIRYSASFVCMVLMH